MCDVPVRLSRLPHDFYKFIPSFRPLAALRALSAPGLLRAAYTTVFSRTNPVREHDFIRIKSSRRVLPKVLGGAVIALPAKFQLALTP